MSGAQWHFGVDGSLVGVAVRGALVGVAAAEMLARVEVNCIVVVVARGGASVAVDTGSEIVGSGSCPPWSKGLQFASTSASMNSTPTILIGRPMSGTVPGLSDTSSSSSLLSCSVNRYKPNAKLGGDVERRHN